MTKVTLFAFSLLILSACTTNTGSTSSTGSGMINKPDSMAVADEMEPAMEVMEEVMEKIERPTTPYVAGQTQPYSQSAMDAALADGKTVFLDFHATWCHVCVDNAPLLEQAFEGLSDENTVGFIVNFDTETALKKRYQVARQSTYLVLKGDDIVNRSLGPQSVESFKKLISS